MDFEKFKMGWLLVTFDLPVIEPEQRKRANNFRKFLIDDGYLKIQLSVYARSCVSFARQETHINRLKKNTPPEGTVRAIFITRFQWDKSFVIHGLEKSKPEGLPEQIQLW